MKVFISWSGKKARRVAIGLKAFLQDVNQRVIAWFSDTDIKAGERWGNELASRLDSTNFGIICVTQESLQSPWVLFEAGALGKVVSEGKVCPYLIDLTRKQLNGPLAQFQSKEASQEQTWEMLQSLNFVMGDDALPEDRLRRYFDTFWPTLEEVIIKVNYEFQPLPQKLRQDLLKSLPPILYHTQKIEMHAYESDLPVWMINWNQAAIYIWGEVIQVATDEQKLGVLMNTLAEDYQGNTDIQELKARVDTWEASFKNAT